MKQGNNRKPNPEKTPKGLHCEVVCVQTAREDIKERPKLAVKDEGCHLIAYRSLGIALYQKGKLIYKDFDSNSPFTAMDQLEMLYIKRMNYYLIKVKNKIYMKKIDGSAPSLFLDLKGSETEYEFFDLVPNHSSRVLLISKSRKILQIDLKTKKVEFQFCTNSCEEESTFLTDYKVQGLDLKAYPDPDCEEKIRSVLLTQLIGDKRLVSICFPGRKILSNTKLHPLFREIRDYEGDGYFNYTTFCVSPNYRYVLLSIIICTEYDDHHVLAILGADEDDYEFKYLTHIMGNPSGSSQVWDRISYLKAFDYFDGDYLLFFGVENDWLKEPTLLSFKFNVKSRGFWMVQSLKTSLQVKSVDQLVHVGNYHYYSGKGGKVMRFRLLEG